jgi:hypothetical protein
MKVEDGIFVELVVDKGLEGIFFFRTILNKLFSNKK